MRYRHWRGYCARKKAPSYAGKLQFANLIQFSATFGYGQKERLKARRGLIICAGSRITCDTQIGDFSF